MTSIGRYTDIIARRRSIYKMVRLMSRMLPRGSSARHPIVAVVMFYAQIGAKELVENAGMQFSIDAAFTFSVICLNSVFLPVFLTAKIACTIYRCLNDRF